VTDIANAIQRMYPCPDNEGETGMCIQDSVTDKTALSSRWRAAASYHQLPEILMESVADDLDYIQVLERSVRRMNNPDHAGAYGIVSLFDNISGDDILKKIVETGNRRLSLSTSDRLLGEDILYLEEEPSELDIAWIIAKTKMKYRYRYIAFPWKGNHKVLIVGNHPNVKSYFREGWFLGYPHSRKHFPKHFVDCYSLDGCPWHSKYTKFNAFVVDSYENVAGVVELINLMEQLTGIIDRMEYEACGVTAGYKVSTVPYKNVKSRKLYRDDLAKALILDADGVNRKILRLLMIEFVDLYRKIRAHEFYNDGMINSFVDHLVKDDDFFAGLRKLDKSDIEGILETPIDDLSLEE
jgi:hypothetical protein